MTLWDYVGLRGITVKLAYFPLPCAPLSLSAIPSFMSPHWRESAGMSFPTSPIMSPSAAIVASPASAFRAVDLLPSFVFRAFSPVKGAPLKRAASGRHAP